MSENYFVKLALVDTSRHVEKKQNLSYLSWPFAIDQLMRHDPAANWEFHVPEMYGETMMISCTVTAFGKPMKMHLPVMDHRNQAVKNPDAFIVNKNMMRCLVKAIACHGLGLHIYAGEDLPMDENGNAASKPAPPKVAPPKPAPSVPANIEGKPVPWQLKVSAQPDTDPETWASTVVDVTKMGLNMAANEADVMSIFKVNRNVFDELKKVSPASYDDVMEQFKKAKTKFREQGESN